MVLVAASCSTKDRASKRTAWLSCPPSSFYLRPTEVVAKDLVGKKVICVTNLKPVKLRGELSEGMILAGEEDGVMSLASVDDSLAIGAKIK